MGSAAEAAKKLTAAVKKAALGYKKFTLESKKPASGAKKLTASTKGSFLESQFSA